MIHEMVAGDLTICRAALARAVCERLAWTGANGRPKLMSCRVALLRLWRAGLIELPSPRNGNGNRRLYAPESTLKPPKADLLDSSIDLHAVTVRPVASDKDSQLWNEAVARFHYLGFKPLPGAQVRYLVEGGAELLGVIGFSAAAWKVAPRDRFIGWSAETKRQGLHLIANNSRFLILPWVRKRNLASFILARCAERIPSDFETRYGYRPVLLETFVERDRFHGSCYRAANWIHVGETQGRGKLDRRRLFALPVKRIYVYPLQRRFREVLCG
jgi:hypothetical protein